MTKKDEDNPDYISIVLCSKGLGANYAKENQLKHRWNKEETIITYNEGDVNENTKVVLNYKFFKVNPSVLDQIGRAHV